MIERLLAADAALDRDDLDRAHGLFAQVAGADPRNAIAVVGLARVALRRGAHDEARRLALRALEIDPAEAAAARLLTALAEASPSTTEAAAPGSVAAGDRATEPAGATPRRSGWRGWLARLLRRG